MQMPVQIHGNSVVLAEFDGVWPSFHDAEILRFELDRGDSTPGRKVVAELRVHVRRYESRGAGTADYHQALVKSVLIDFRFSGIEDLSVSDFNHQNVIDGIILSADEKSGRVSVEIAGIYGFDGQWTCDHAEVVRVTRGA
ncbi:MAG: Imm50 family immunity protein [Pseudomonadota bacterium]